MPDADEPAYFITTDRRIIEGARDPDDLRAMHGAIPITPERALELADEERAAKEAAGDDAPPPEEEKPLPDGMRTLTPEMMKTLGKSAVSGMDDLYKVLKKQMTPDTAHRIRRLRETRTWRGVARAAWPQFPIWEPRSNQLAGMTICRAAAEALNEDPESTPWN